MNVLYRERTWLSIFE